MEGDERIVRQLLINFSPDHLKILRATAATLPKFSCMLGVELPTAYQLYTLSVSLASVAHTPKYWLCFCWCVMTGKRPKSVEYVTEHTPTLCGRSVVSTGVSAAHLRNKYNERGCTRETTQSSGPRSSFRSAWC